jgi:hypothetical protein
LVVLFSTTEATGFAGEMRDSCEEGKAGSAAIVEYAICEEKLE